MLKKRFEPLLYIAMGHCYTNNFKVSTFPAPWMWDVMCMVIAGIRLLWWSVSTRRDFSHCVAWEGNTTLRKEELHLWEWEKGWLWNINLVSFSGMLHACHDNYHSIRRRNEFGGIDSQVSSPIITIEVVRYISNKSIQVMSSLQATRSILGAIDEQPRTCK